MTLNELEIFGNLLREAVSLRQEVNSLREDRGWDAWEEDKDITEARAFYLRELASATKLAQAEFERTAKADK